MTRLLITGALGHIGSQLIHAIKPGEFDEVVLIDNMLTQRYCSLFNLPEGVRFRFEEVDVLSESLGDVVAGADAVIHLAAITNAAASFDKQEEVERVNLVGTERVARAAAAAGARMLFLSTTSVYGTSADVVDEDCRPDELRPQSPYATSKLRAEQLLAELSSTLNLKYIACRFGTIFGTSIGMRFHTAVNKFCWQASMGLPITVWRTALDQRRPYLDLGDAVRSIRFVLERNLFDNQIYNVLSVNSTVGEIIDVIRSHVPDLDVKFVDTPIMNQLSYTVANDKFRRLGFEFNGDLQRGISDTLKLLRAARAGAVVAN